MIKNYLRTAIRAILKSRGTAFINIAGLAIGIACCILIAIFVKNELSYDTWHEKSDRIYRVLTIDRALGVSNNLVGITLPALGPTLTSELPEVLQFVRCRQNGRTLVQHGDKSLYVDDTILAEAGLFTIFDFELAAGDPKTALSSPNQVVLSQEMAHKLFGDDNPLGKMLRLDNDTTTVAVTGVLADLKGNSHFAMDVVQSLVPTAVDTNLAQWLTSWRSISMTTYVLLDDPASEHGVEEKMEPLIRKHDVGPNFNVTLQPLTETHLQSAEILFDGFNTGKGNLNYVYGLSAVALFVILIASFNFMNLATARSAHRAREVGMRKVVGATRRQLVQQYLSESIVLCFIALAIALLLVELARGFFTLPFDGSVTLHLAQEPDLAVGLLLLTLSVGMLAGLYPAIVLSGFQVVKVIRGSFATSASGLWLRRVLVVTQFAASIAMMVGTVVVYQQLKYMKTKSLGFNKEQVLVLPLTDRQLRGNAEALRNELSQNADIVGIASTGSMPGSGYGRTGLQPEGASEDDVWIVSITAMDDRLMSVLGFELVAGRNYATEFATDEEAAIIINEAFAAELGWQEPLDKTIRMGENERKVIGVVKDFHFTALRHTIEPLVLLYRPQPGFVLAVRLRPENMSETVTAIGEAWRKVNPGYPFEYSFFDEDFDQLYRSDEQFAGLVSNFTWMSVFIACLGLFGLAAFTAERRTKEIGVRKVMGASVAGLASLLSIEFVRLVLVASAVAVPVSYFAMNSWLINFAYRVSLSYWLFAAAACAALIIALLTVSYQAIRAALRNPVDALRCE